jgi:hypothetical protein
MRLVMTLLARDEADILESHVRFHQAAGVDFFVATDHDSHDGTSEILDRFVDEGVMHVIREGGGALRQSEWVTRMARLAAAEFQADWVINSDADEFWWPSGGDLKHVLSAIPGRFGVVQTFVRPFLPPGGAGVFHERMIVRLAAQAAINDPSSPFRVNTRLVHRADGDISIGTGNTSFAGSRLKPLAGWAPVEVLHFPIRSFAHFERKFLAHFETVGGKRRDHMRAHEAARSGRLVELYEEISVDEHRLAHGLRAGVLAIDTRLRDAIAAIGADAGGALPVWHRTSTDEAHYAVDEAVHIEGELVRLARRVDELESRVRARTRPRRISASRGGGGR